jgi:hypothetical protein
MSGNGDREPQAKVTLAVEMRGAWVTPETIAATASALKRAADGLLEQFRGEAGDPGDINIRLDVPADPPLADWPHP